MLQTLTGENVLLLNARLHLVLIPMTSCQNED